MGRIPHSRVARIALAVAAGLALAIPVLAQVSASYDLSWHVIAGGGGRMGSAGYILEGTMGQPVTGRAPGGYTLCSGYWCAGADYGYTVYLPLVLRNAD